MLNLVKKKPMSEDDHLRNNNEIENALDLRDVKITKKSDKTYLEIPLKKGKIKFEITEA